MGKMGKLSKGQLKNLFTRIDGRLSKSINIFLIGGASAILGYNTTKETNDVDVDGEIPAEFEKAFTEEAKALNLELHLSSVGVFSPPEGYRERAKFEDFPRKKLRIWSLDQYDLAISKIDRGIEKDYADIARVHKKAPYDRNRLIEIFSTEYIKTVAIGDPRIKKMNLVDVAVLLFGEDVADDTMAKVELSAGALSVNDA